MLGERFDVSNANLIAYGEAAIPILMSLVDRGSELDLLIDHLILMAPVLFFNR